MVRSSGQPRLWVVNRWARKDQTYKLGVILEACGATWAPIELSEIAAGADGTLLRFSGDSVMPVDADDAPDGVLWRISESAFVACAPVIMALERMAPLATPYAALAVCADKTATARVLASAGLPQVPTVVLSPLSPVPFLGTDETVIKPAISAEGKDVSLRAPGEISPDDGRLWVAQPYAGNPDDHQRVLVADSSPLVAIRRVREPRSKDIVNNIAAGGTPVLAEPDAVAVELAVATAEAVGCRVAAVDLARWEGRWAVLEVNSTPGLSGIWKAARGTSEDPWQVYMALVRAFLRSVLDQADERARR